MKAFIVLILGSFLLAPALFLPEDGKQEGVILSTKRAGNVILPTHEERAKGKLVSEKQVSRKEPTEEQKRKGMLLLTIFAGLRTK